MKYLLLSTVLGLGGVVGAFAANQDEADQNAVESPCKTEVRFKIIHLFGARAMKLDLRTGESWYWNGKQPQWYPIAHIVLPDGFGSVPAEGTKTPLPVRESITVEEILKQCWRGQKITLSLADKKIEGEFVEFTRGRVSIKSKRALFPLVEYQLNRILMAACSEKE